MDMHRDGGTAEAVTDEATRPSVPDLPPRLLIDLRTDCNLKCPMCIVHGDPENPRLKNFLRRSMPPDKARVLLDEIMPAKPLVQPALWSEPLLSPDFQEHVGAMKARGITVAMNTNGLQLTPEIARFMVEVGVDSVSISIDAMTPETLKAVRGIDRLDKIHRGVENLLAARNGGVRPRVGVSFTIQDANRHEHDAFIAHWTQRVDVVRVGEVYDGTAFPNVAAHGSRTPCHALYSTMPIHVDGTVAICCLDTFAETPVGNVFEDGVAGVWHGPRLTEIRRLHEAGRHDEIPICRTCDRWASNTYREEVRDGLLIRRSAEYTYYNRIDRLENWQGGLQATHTTAGPAAGGTGEG